MQQIQQYLQIIIRRGWIVVLAAVLTAGSAYGFSRIQEQRNPVYKSTISLLIQPNRPDFGQAQAARQLLRSYVAWMQSNYRAQAVIDRLELDMVPEQLLGDVTIASDDSRLVIQIDVENSNGELANQIALEWANLFIEYRNQENNDVRREDRIDAVLIDDPRFSLDSPDTDINTIAGFILGALVGVAIVFVLEFLESGVIRSSQDIDKYLTMQVLGSIPPTEG